MSYSSEQRFTSVFSVAVLMIVAIIGGLGNSWLLYLIYRKRVRFPTNYFAAYAVLADVTLCCIGAPVFIAENIFIITGDKGLNHAWMVACMIKLLLTLFHVLLNTMCFVLERTSSVIRKWNMSLGRRNVGWKRVSNCFVWILCLAVPAAFLLVLVLNEANLRSKAPDCSYEGFYLPVLFICFAAIIFSLALTLAMAYRMRNSRRVFALSMRTSIVRNSIDATQVHGHSGKTLTAKLSCTTQEGTLNQTAHITCVPSGSKQSREKQARDSPSSLFKPEVTYGVSVEAETTAPETEGRGGRSINARRPTPSPVRRPVIMEATYNNSKQKSSPLTVNGPLLHNGDVLDDIDTIELQSTQMTCNLNVESPLTRAQHAPRGEPNTRLSPFSVSPTVQTRKGSTLRLSVLSSVSENVPENYRQPIQRESDMSLEDSSEILDLTYSTVSIFCVTVLLMLFISEFANTLFIKGFAGFALTQLTFVLFYVAAAGKPFIYIRSSKSLRKLSRSSRLMPCICKDPNVT